MSYFPGFRDTQDQKSFLDVKGPKKNFCIIKIWMANCSFQNPEIITNEVNGLESQGCLFKKHNPEY